MAADCYILIARLFLTVTLTLGEIPRVHYGPTNGSITLEPKINGDLEEILWKWNENKVHEIDKFSNEQYGQFRGRTYVNSTTGDLTIRDLTNSDNGIYSVEAQVGGKLQHSQYPVEVIDPVTDPVVTCQMSGSTPTLICASDLSPLTQYSWEGPEGPLTSSGSELNLQGTEDRDSVYTCLVKNPVSESRRELAIQHCYTQSSLTSNLTIALSVLAVVLAAVLFGAWVYYKKLYKASRQSSPAPGCGGKEDGEKGIGAESALLINVEKTAGQDHKKNNLDEENLKEEDKSHPGNGGVGIEPEGVSIEQADVGIELGGVRIEQEGVGIEQGGISDEHGVVRDEQGALMNEGSPSQGDRE
ncbi:hypothetical protein GJAV_G00210280 [Gymnothorax javanicus]|nr:hypothetical protein GJAV_G00210280 [Gymnothorax javanicus]